MSRAIAAAGGICTARAGRFSEGGVSKWTPKMRPFDQNGQVAWRWIGADLELDVHAQPGARRRAIKGTHAGAIKVSIVARAIDGAANEALLDYLAELLQVPRRRCVLISGQTSRHKRVRIESPDRAHADRLLASWLQNSS
jgi:uncharacterized protein (TIGR00251 family)